MAEGTRLKEMNEHIKGIEDKMQSIATECNQSLEDKMQNFGVEYNKKLGVLVQQLGEMQIESQQRHEALQIEAVR